MDKYKKVYFIVPVIIIIIVSVVILLSEKKPITIAFEAELTGPISSLGVEARNAFILRINQVNEAGGINGHQVEYVLLDNQGSGDILKNNYSQIIEEEIPYVIAPVVSSMAPFIEDIASSEEVLIMSPTIGSDLLVDRDDYFLRIAPSNQEQPKCLIEYLSHYETNPSVTFVSDERNSLYVNEFVDYFKSHYDGEIEVLTIGLEDTMSLQEAYVSFSSNITDVVVLLAPASETGTFVQMLSVGDLSPEVIGVSWAMTDDLLATGGTSVEGMKFVYMDYPLQPPHYDVQFIDAYLKAYGSEPSFVSALTYQATDMLLASLLESKDYSASNVKEALLGMSYESLGVPIELNAYGDRIQTFEIYVLQDQVYVKYNEAKRGAGE